MFCCRRFEIYSSYVAILDIQITIKSFDEFCQLILVISIVTFRDYYWWFCLVDEIHSWEQSPRYFTSIVVDSTTPLRYTDSKRVPAAFAIPRNL